MKWFSRRPTQPSPTVGDWTDRRETLFWSEADPLAVKFEIEKMTVTLLRRDTAVLPALRYVGDSSGSGSPRGVRLSLEAVIADARLYRFEIERTMPRRWTTADAFAADCAKSFAYWCSKLRLAPSDVDRRGASAERLAALVRETIDREDAAAAVIEDPAPVLALQCEVLEALRDGWGFFDAHKEGGSHLFFDGAAYIRADYGEEPNLHEVYTDENAFLAALRRFYDWETWHPTYPHRPPERDVWMAIRRKLYRRDGNKLQRRDG